MSQILWFSPVPLLISLAYSLCVPTLIKQCLRAVLGSSTNLLLFFYFDHCFVSVLLMRVRSLPQPNSKSLFSLTWEK